MKNAVEIAIDILGELRRSLESIDPARAESFADEILAADRVFVCGAGRSLLMVRGLAMRLMQIGFDAYVVGETITPAIGPGDLLIVGSGSGETGALKLMAEKAKKFGARLALITINPDSTIGRLADCVVRIAAATTKGAGVGISSFQPGANMFEQSLLLFCDAAVIRIIEKKDIRNTNAELMRRHANLE